METGAILPCEEAVSRAQLSDDRNLTGLAICRLGVIEILLRERKEEGLEGSFIGGTKPSHSDFCIFALVESPLIHFTLVSDVFSDFILTR